MSLDFEKYQKTLKHVKRENFHNVFYLVKVA